MVPTRKLKISDQALAAFSDAVHADILHFAGDWPEINLICQKSSTSKVGDEGGAPIETIRNYIENQGR